MSSEATDWAYKQNCGDPVAKLILIILANESSSDFVVRTTAQDLAKIADCSTQMVHKKLKYLCELALISNVSEYSKYGHRITFEYQLNIDGGW